MKKIFYYVIFFVHFNSNCQNLIVPETIYFAGLQLNLNQDVRYELQKQVLMLTKNKNYFNNKILLTDIYFPIINDVFEQESIPTDFKYLIIQESGMQSDAVSTSNAVGYWQFKKETAQEMGITVNSEVDERKHITAATRAAAKYLKKNYQFTINWLYALVAYNTGLGGVKQFLKSEHVGATEMNLTMDTHWYALKFLAHKLAFEDKVGYNLNPEITLLSYDKNTKGKTLNAISDETGVNFDVLKNYNKWLSNGIVPLDKDYAVLLPVSASEKELIASKFGITLRLQKPTSESPIIVQKPKTDFKTKTEEVPLLLTYNELEAIQAREGDNPAKLAFAGGISPEKFFKYNDMLKFEEIKAGNIYYLESKNSKSILLYHTVKAGETMWDISQKYGVKLKQLYKKNQMEENEGLQEGRMLYLKYKRPSDEPIKFNLSTNPVVAKQETVMPLKKDTTIVAPKEIIVKKEAIEKPAPTAVMQNIPQKDTSKTVQETSSQPIISNTKFLKLLLNNAVIKDSAKTYHIVGQLQTLYSISKHYNTKSDSLKIWNSIGQEGLQFDQKIVVSKSNSALKNNYKIFVVKQTCTIEDISTELNKSIDEITLWNDKKSGFFLQGELVRVK